MPCPICNYNQRRDLDRALLNGVSLASLHQRYSFSIPDLQHHQKHLLEKMAQTEKRFHQGLHQGLFCKLNLVMEMVLAVVRGARAGQDFKLFLQASREFTRILSLMHKMAIHLEPEMIYWLMFSPQWDLQDNLLPDAFQALDKTRQTLKCHLFSPCPDPEPAVATPPETPTPTPEPPVPQAPALAGDDTIFRQSQNTSAKPARKMREISAKLLPKRTSCLDLTKEYQEDMASKKIPPPKRENLFRRLYRKWEITEKKHSKESLAK